MAALELSARLNGWHTEIQWDVSTRSLAALLGLDRGADFASDKERDDAEVVVRVAPGCGREAAKLTSVPVMDWVERVSSQMVFHGKAAPLSRSHVRYKEISDVVQATGSTATPHNAYRHVGIGNLMPAHPARTLPRFAHDNARQIIRQRRSALDFDGSASMDLDQFLSILWSTLPTTQSLWMHPGWNFKPRIHLVLYCHRIVGLPAGIYLLCRDLSSLNDLRHSMAHDGRTAFAWRPLGELAQGLPLYLLGTGDVARFAEFASCRQEIASHGCYAASMIADLASARRDSDDGSWYRRLYWESGYVFFHGISHACWHGALGDGCTFVKDGRTGDVHRSRSGWLPCHRDWMLLR